MSNPSAGHCSDGSIKYEAKGLQNLTEAIYLNHSNQLCTWRIFSLWRIVAIVCNWTNNSKQIFKPGAIWIRFEMVNLCSLLGMKAVVYFIGIIGISAFIT